MSAAIEGAEEFAASKVRAVERAEANLLKANERLSQALDNYSGEVARQQERGDGFFPSSYLAARKEAVLASKFFESKNSALRTARAEADASTLSLGGQDA